MRGFNFCLPPVTSKVLQHKDQVSHTISIGGLCQCKVVVYLMQPNIDILILLPREGRWLLRSHLDFNRVPLEPPAVADVDACCDDCSLANF